MREFLNNGKNRTVFLTSHVIQDMENFVDEVIFMERGGGLLTISLTEFKSKFRCYRMYRNGKSQNFLKEQNHQFNPQSSPQYSPQYNSLAENPDKNPDKNLIKNIEDHAGYWDFFSFAPKNRVLDAVREQGFPLNDLDDLKEVSMSLEDAFIGYTGRY